MYLRYYIAIMSVEEAIQEIKGLSAQKRLDIVTEIWDTISIDSPDLAVSELHKNILDSRLTEHENHSDRNLSLKEFKAELEDDLRNNSKAKSQN